MLEKGADGWKFVHFHNTTIDEATMGPNVLDWVMACLPKAWQTLLNLLASYQLERLIPYLMIAFTYNPYAFDGALSYAG